MHPETCRKHDKNHPNQVSYHASYRFPWMQLLADTHAMLPIKMAARLA